LRSLSGVDHRWFKTSTKEEMPVTGDSKMIMMIIIIIIILNRRNNLHSTITDDLQKCTDLTEELVRV
jgi:hypothetical protein